MQYDHVIIGGGIVGLSTAWQLQQRYPDHRIVVLEKERSLACHQTGHNSGVVHSGIYYPPGSFKARFCQAGARATLEYCATKGISQRQIGKLIVATSAAELPRLEALYKRAGAHELGVEWLDAARLGEMETSVSGRAAIHVPSTAIVDFPAVARQFAADFEALGGRIVTGCQVHGLQENARHVIAHTSLGEYTGRYLLACGGLQADRLARAMGLPVDFRIIPVRGEYYQLPPEKRALVRHLIYPVPAPDMPFLGVHLTPMVDGRLTVGPNAVFAWRRENYGHGTGAEGGWRQSFRDAGDSLGFPGFWRMAARHWRFALEEARNSRSRSAYLEVVRRYCPELTEADLQPSPPGIRAQAVTRDGALVHDFLFAESARSLHVCNAPSPAATSAIPIGAHLCDKLAASGRL
ncbi:L-2-hydroxyglutarate oxidase [Gilvimarinus sp. F26214L]|uniref:L-2-hydroxyglutarate oxidase n=1 Tax=Gilvimarinus sp. DZF01 TaxID=3461371 RepID=UPI00404632F4